MPVQLWQSERHTQKRCRNKNIREDVFYEEFIKSFNAMLMNKDDVIRYCINSLSSLPNINAVWNAVDITKLDEVQKAKIQISDLYAERERIERFMNLIKKSRKLHRFSRAAFMRSVREAIIDNENIIFRWNY